jgi:AcrR family transcriptional regulator
LLGRSQTPKGQRARERILKAAERLLVTHGFHGTSMRDVAKAASLPLATVVYHFARKEQLYAALLHDIGAELVATLDATDDFVAALVRWTIAQPGRVKLLLRELLDNPTRVKTATQLPLAPFLERAALGRGEVAVLHVVGALSYVVAAWPTVDRIVGAKRARELHAGYEREAIAFARRALEEAHGSRPASPARASRARAPRARDD